MSRLWVRFEWLCIGRPRRGSARLPAPLSSNHLTAFALGARRDRAPLRPATAPVTATPFFFSTGTPDGKWRPRGLAAAPQSVVVTHSSLTVLHEDRAPPFLDLRTNMRPGGQAAREVVMRVLILSIVAVVFVGTAPFHPHPATQVKATS